ncbi:hypothetical protein DFJ58DRAFT_43527 [Suillus subalutaceus]|uniref:uncharacterized protein n=1 Tax=Suillus subalutaceus TaxID=48586 RepID=UPI001B878673|nr:uncharacterized protein DFJ58DRAFT_43527 [Suillus subalutaceus]KAG1870209.1 hypothetical protein DFJ58DRAFT_43527 [Suillus subalutaceus]
MPRQKPLPLGYVNDHGYTALVKISLSNLSVTPCLCYPLKTCGFASKLSDNSVDKPIRTLRLLPQKAFSGLCRIRSRQSARMQKWNLNIARWRLWMCLLLEVLGLCTDARHQVCVGAIQTLFRAMQLTAPRLRWILGMTAYGRSHSRYSTRYLSKPGAVPLSPELC